MAQPYASLLDITDHTPLPLTNRYAEYLKERLTRYDQDIAQFDQNEANLKAELEACRALRSALVETRERYRRDLGPHHTAPAVEQPVWPVQPEDRSNTAQECPKCGQPMYLTARYGFVHEVDGPLWVAGGQWCVQATSVEVTHVLPAIESEPAS
ncbi:hypothetical protein ACGFNP_25600 [Nonomuraea sp. NPDC049269]|uniref:hypothetical protein n=1 Tax=Nonomuraea sp. NPDC049269 TaxID=3364349 RepID=UPI0037165A50